jgi:hypothetical protein
MLDFAGQAHPGAHRAFEVAGSRLMVVAGVDGSLEAAEAAQYAAQAATTTWICWWCTPSPFHPPPRGPAVESSPQRRWQRSA